MKVLRISAGGLPLALDAAVVRAIERPRRVVRLPGAPAYVRGVAEVRGQVVAVVALAERLGLPAGKPRSSAGVVLVDSGEPVALEVEAVEGVEPLQPEGLRDLGGAGRRAGLRALGPGSRLLLDAEALVDGRPLAPLQAVLDKVGAPVLSEGSER